jgi:putative hydrolase of the HAD superfamily
MGGTLEEIAFSERTKLNCGVKVLEYMEKHGIVLNMTPREFMEFTLKGNRKYKEENVDRELTPFEIWSEWKLKDVDLDRERLRAISEQISLLWEITYYDRYLRPDAKIMLDALKKEGYRLGIISNTPSYTQVSYLLNKYGIRDYFEVVTLSSICGYRKTNRIAFDITLADMNAKPLETVYVGDTISRDVIGARNAGLAMSIRINSGLTEISDRKLERGTADADYIIKNLIEIQGILENYNNKLK